MNIKKTLKTANGTYEFQGEMSEEQFDYVFGVGLAYLLDAGADLNDEAINAQEELTLN